MIFKAIKDLKDNLKKEPIVINMDEASAKSVIDQYNNMKLGADAFIEKTNLSDDAMQSYLHTVQSGNATFDGYTQHINATNSAIGLMGVKTKIATALVKGLKFALSTIGVTLVLNLIGSLVTAIDDYIHRSEKIAEAAEEARNKINELNSEFKNTKNTVDDIKERYAELAQGIDTLTNKNLSLSDDDYKEFLDLNNQLAELFPELTINYDKNGNAILDLQGDVSSIIGTLDTLIEKERDLANQEIIKNLPNIFNNFRQNVKKYEKEIDGFEKKYNATQKLSQTKPSFIGEGFEEGLSVVQWQFDDVSEDEIDAIKDEINNILKASDMWIDDSYLSSGKIDEDTRYAQLFIEEEYLDEISEAINNRIIGLANEINSSKDKLEAEISSFNSDLYSWLSNDAVFKSQDEDKQDIIKQLLFKDNWLKDAYSDPSVDEEEWNSLAKWLQARYINAINKINQEDIKKKLLDLFNVDLSPEKKIQIALELKDYFEKENINIPLNFILDGDTEGSTQNLLDRMESSIFDIAGGDARSAAELKKYTNGFTEAQMNTWLEITLGITNAGEAIKKYENEINQASKQKPIEFFTEDNIEKIDAYKDKITDLGSYLQSINEKHELSADEIAILNTEYDIVANSVEEYKQKIIELMNKTSLTSDIMIDLSEAIKSCTDEETKERLQSLYDALSNLSIEAQNNANSFGRFETAISSLQSKADVLRDINSGIREVGYIDSSKLDDIISAYPELSTKVAEYNQGLITSTDLFNELKSAYEKDAQNYKIAMAYKLQYNEEFYSSVVENIPDLLKEQAEGYNINFGEYKNLCEAKLALDKEYFYKRAILEAKSRLTESAKNLINSDNPYELISAGGMFGAASLYSNAEKDLEEFKTFLEGFDTTLSGTINFDTSWEEYGKDKNDSEDKSDLSEIDWAEQSLSVLQTKVDELQDALDNTYGIDNQIQAIDNLNDALEDLKGGYNEAYENYEDRYTDALGKLGNDPEIKAKIESGEEFSLGKYDSETATIIQEAITAYNKMLETKKKINEITEQINKNENEEKVQVRLDGYQTQADLISSMLQDESLTAKERNKLLEREKEIKNSILLQNILLAKTEEEKLKYQEEYLQYLRENKKSQYENTRDGINTRISYYDSRVKDVQNAIALEEAKGGQGSEALYTKMNGFLQEEIDWEEKNLKNAIDMRDQSTWGTPEYEYYNNQIQEAQDNINSCKIAQIENNKAIKLLPVKYYEDLNKELEEELDILAKQQEKVESAIGYASSIIQDQVDVLNKNKENITDFWDDQIEAVQDQKDALEKSNDALKRQIELENAKYELEKAMRNKTVRVYRKGEGFVYESDQEEVRKAQQELDDLTYNHAVAEYDETIKNMTEQKEDAIELIDDQIKEWEEYAEKIEKVNESYEKYLGLQNLIEVFGVDSVSAILGQDASILGEFEGTLNAIKTETTATQEKIDANERLIASIQKEAEAYVKNATTIVDSQKTIKEAVTDNEKEIEAINKRTETVGTLTSAWTTTEEGILLALTNIQNANNTAKENEFTTLSERINNLKSFKKDAEDVYKDISKIVSNAQSALASLASMEEQANKSSLGSGKSSTSSGTKTTTNNSSTKSSSSSSSKTKTTTTSVQKYHSGGVVGSGNKELPNALVSLTGDNLKPDEVMAKLLNNEVVLTQPQVGNLFNNLGVTYKSLIPTKANNDNLAITIGDVHVHNPNNSDMIVDEIVKELPLKVIQKLNSRK